MALAATAQPALYSAHTDKALGRSVNDVIRPLSPGGVPDAANAAAAFAEAWQAGGRRDDALAKAALTQIESILRTFETARAAGEPFRVANPFFAYYPLLRAYELLRDGGRLDDATAGRVRALVLDVYEPLERGDHNRAICAATGLAAAARLFPDAPQADAWRAYADGVWGDWYGHRDTTENAPNYNAIVATYLFLLAEQTGRLDQMRDPAVRAMYERWRDQVSPAGLVAGYGDGDEWANWAGLVGGLERAATFYREPTFRWAAARVFESGAANRPVGRAGASAWYLQLAGQWADETIEPKRPDLAAQVLTRREPGDDAALDKLVLAPDRNPGSPFALIELYGRGGHSHPSWGAVNLLEVDGLPLLGGLGYHNRAPAHANLLLMTPPGEEFPHRTTAFAADRWYEMVVPTRELPPLGDDPDDLRRRIDTAMFRVETPTRVEMSVSGLRLVGPAGERVIDAFEDPQAWQAEAGDDADAPGGGRVLRGATAGQRITFFRRRGIGLTFDIRQYPELRYWWKLSNNDAEIRPLMFRVMGNGDPLVAFAHWEVAAPRMSARCVSATASTRDGDSLGVARFEDYFTPGTTLVRRVLLTREGVLLVRDDLTPGPAAEGWSAGPIWHLHHEPERGETWADAAGSDRLNAGATRLLVYHVPPAAGDGRVYDVAGAKLWGGYEPFTSFARRTLRAGETATFVTVLLPHSPTTPADALAAAVAGDFDAGTTTVRLGSPSTREIRIEVSGEQWGVHR